MSRAVRSYLTLVAAALALAGAIWGTAVVERGVSETRAQRIAAAADLTFAATEQELAVRTREVLDSSDATEHYMEDGRRFQAALTATRSEAEGDEEILALVSRIASVYEQWERRAERSLALGRSAELEAETRTRLVDAIHDYGQQLQAAVAAEQDADQERLTLGLVLATLVLVLLLGIVGTRALNRRERERRITTRADERYRSAQAEFGDTMQVVGDEREAHDLLKRHLERAVTGSTAVVLNRNNSANRLEATTEAPVELAVVLDAGVEPRACVAARLGRPHSASPDHKPLLECELCGKSGNATCTPLLVSGEVIGSVLVEHPEPLDPSEQMHVSESVAQAAPVLGNLRNLAIAEMRASTDALTGLPNRRALQDTLKRMVAQSGRSLQPLAAVALDLDHFKALNDRFGHEKGDEALAAVGRVIAESLRESDFAARAGGEEFCILLPDTDADGASVVADKLRLAISRIEVPGVERSITGSFGIAAYPLHAFDAPTLLRKADRALYLAKEKGRNRVELAAAPSTGSLVADATG